jgi:protocatechuate 3,4-dioxygenase beta subunit
MKIILFISLLAASTACYGQQVKQPTDRAIADYCDGCDLMYEGIPLLSNISSETPLAKKDEPGSRLEISGIVYKPDGKTPAKDIVLYIYHTDAQGLYSAAQDQVHAKRHGHLRGWVKTNGQGEFKIKSIRPAAYPRENIPAHIHIFVKEPGKTLYYIDEVWFDDDPFVSSEMKRKAQQRGGDLLIHLTTDSKNIWNGNLSIILGKNIPNYK